MKTPIFYIVYDDYRAANFEGENKLMRIVSREVKDGLIHFLFEDNLTWVIGISHKPRIRIRFI